MWKDDIQIICDILTGQRRATWKAALNAIASGASWRESIKNWALSHGITPQNWRLDLIAISDSLVPVPARTWKEALRYIRLFYEGTPPELRAFVTQDGYRFLTQDNIVFTVRG